MIPHFQDNILQLEQDLQLLLRSHHNVALFHLLLHVFPVPEGCFEVTGAEDKTLEVAEYCFENTDFVD